MSDDPQYSSGGDSGSNKRKYDDQSAPPPRRPTGFSAPIIAAPSDSAAPSYNSVAPPADEIQLAKQRAQEIAARLFNNASAAGAAPPAETKRPRFENGGGYDSGDNLKSHGSSSIPVFNGFNGSSKKIDVPNGRVGVIIGKGGETIKYLQTQSGAKIQVTRDMDADLNSSTRIVELMGTPEQISKAEQLINDVLAGAETGGQGGGGGSRRAGGQVGGEQFVMKIPNNKVGLVIGKGGETIKSMQGRTGARIQVIPLHLPPGDPSNERTLQIDGTTEQIENAKQLVFEVISENRPRNPSMSGGYGQQGYQARPPSWGPPGGQQQQQQQPGYGYGQPGGYPAPPSQYNAQGSYPGYPQQSAGGYASNWDQSTAPPPQQGGGYDYYTQQQNPAGPGAPVAAADTTGGYGYPTSGYPQQGQGYSQDGYGGYQAQAQAQAQSGYGYDQQQGYGAATGPTDPHATSYADPSQAPAGSAPTPPPAAAGSASAGQQGYGSSQPSPNPNPASYPSQQGYGAPPTSQAAGGYGAGYGAPPPQGQKQPPSAQSYGQATQSPTTAAGGGYSQQQAGYPLSQSGGYGQPESGSQRGYGGPPPSYGGPPGSQQGYGQAQQYGGYGSGGYAQPPPQYSADGGAAPPSSQAAKKSPQS